MTRVLQYQQPYRVISALAVAGVTHDFEGTVALRKVSVRPDDVPTEGIFFCPVYAATLLTTTQPGDGNRLSEEVFLAAGFAVPDAGVYDLTVHVRTNGRIELSKPVWKERTTEDIPVFDTGMRR